MVSLPAPEFVPSEDELEPVSADVISMQERRGGGALVGATALEQSVVVSTDLPYELRHLGYLDLKKIEAARSGPKAFEALVDEYKAFIRFMASQYFLKGGSHEDVMQEAMLGFYKAVRDYDGTSPFKSFAELCVRRQVITAIKTADRFKHAALNNYVSFSHTPAGSDGDGDITLGDALPDTSRLPEDIVAGRESFDGLIDVLSSNLTYLEHSVLKMYLEGASYEEMAEELAEETKSIDNALQRVKRKILDYLEATG